MYNLENTGAAIKLFIKNLFLTAYKTGAVCTYHFPIFIWVLITTCCGLESRTCIKIWTFLNSRSDILNTEVFIDNL